MGDVTCACGCGEAVKTPGSVYRPGHHWRARRREKMCECGCGLSIPPNKRSRFVRGHQVRARTGTPSYFWSLTAPGDLGCIVWTGATDSSGYGMFTLRGGSRAKAHRFAYELQVGPIPDGMVIDHLCRTRRCVNVDHMEVVTPAENTLRGVGFAAVNARKTHCKRGHEFTPENTVPGGSDGTSRRCRTCKNLLNQQYRERRAS